ncbi:MAG: hypothetical protein ABW185_26280, partial [Sedimenticola sp.]
MDRILEHMERLERENDNLKMQLEMVNINRQIEDLQTQDDHRTCVKTGFPSPAKHKTRSDDMPQGAHSEPLIEDNVTVRKRPGSSRTTMVKAAAYDGTSSWLDYKAHFETCSEINGWSYVDKGLYLAVSLRGQAQGVFGNLSERTKDYNSLVKAIGERFAPPNQTELYRVQLRERRQKASESLSELGQDIRRLTNMAYPSAPADLKETLAKEQFVDSLISMDMRLRVKQARPNNLNDAVRHAVELEAFQRAEKARLTGQGIMSSVDMATHDSIEKKAVDPGLERLQSTVDRLAEQLQRMQGELKQNRQSQSRKASYDVGNVGRTTQNMDRTCFNCGSASHFRRNCPKLDRKPKVNKE